MILVDSSVWIDFFLGKDNPQVQTLAHLLADTSTPLAVADLVIFEVLRGFRETKALQEAQTLLCSLPIAPLGGLIQALAAAKHYRVLRKNGITVASGIDVLQASYCIEQGHILLHRDADFQIISKLTSLSTWSH